MLSGGFIFIIPAFQNLIFPILISLFILVFLASINRKSHLFKGYYLMLAENEELEVGYLQGPIAFASAVLITSVLYGLFPNSVAIIMSSLLAMIIGDTFAAVIGKRFGKHKIKIGNKAFKRTLEGCLAMFISTSALSSLAFYLVGSFNIAEVLTLSIVATLIEAFSPSKWDDFLIPVITSIVMIALNWAIL